MLFYSAQVNYEDPVARTEWDEEQQKFVHLGMTRQELAEEQAYFDKQRQPGDANLAEVSVAM